MKINKAMVITVLSGISLNAALFFGFDGLDEKWIAVTSAAIVAFAGMLQPKKHR